MASPVQVVLAEVLRISNHDPAGIMCREMRDERGRFVETEFCTRGPMDREVTEARFRRLARLAGWEVQTLSTADTSFRSVFSIADAVAPVQTAAAAT